MTASRTGVDAKASAVENAEDKAGRRSLASIQCNTRRGL